MGDNILPCARDQRSLLPPAWQDWVPEGDLSWFIVDAVAQRGVRQMNFGCPTGSNEYRFEQQLGNAFIPYPRPANFDLPVSDGRQSKA